MVEDRKPRTSGRGAVTASNIARRLGIGNKEWASNIIKRARVSGDIRAVRRKPTPDEIERARANEYA